MSRARQLRGAGAGLGVLALTLLSACASAPVPDPHMELPTRWRNQAAAPATPAPDLHDWWRAFNEPRLSALVDESLRANLDVAGAVERLRAARVLHGRADAPFLPALALRTDDPMDPDASASYFTAGFDAQWELGLFGRREGAQRIARGDLDAAEADLSEARVSLVAEVVRNWIDLRAAEEQTRLLERVLDTQRRSLRMTGVRVELHLEAAADEAQAEAAVARAEAALSAPRAEADAAAQRLALLLGRTEPDPAWLQGGALPRLGERGITTTPADLLRTRPDIARAQARVVQAAGELGIARSTLYPNIGIRGSLVWSTSTLTHKSSELDEIAAFGPVIDIPLFDWGLRQAKAKARSHELEASVLTYRQAILQGVSDVETALGNLAQQRRRKQASEAAVAALTRVADRQATRERLGLISPLEREESLVQLDRAKLDLSEALAAHAIAYVALYKALGGAPEPRSEAGSTAPSRPPAQPGSR